MTVDVPDKIGRVNGSSRMESVDEGVIALKVSTERGLVDVVEVQIGGWNIVITPPQIEELCVHIWVIVLW